MKFAITGKGGVGKTTLTSLLAYAYAARGDTVMAIDADPSPCLGPALGFPKEKLEEISPIAEMEELILERTGAQKGTYGAFFKINPRTDDIPDRFSALHRGIRLLELGAVDMGGSGCICPEGVLLKSLVSNILLYRGEVVLLDMYAGVEHLSRATTDAVDAMLIVAEPTARESRFTISRPNSSPRRKTSSRRWTAYPKKHRGVPFIRNYFTWRSLH